MVNMTNTVAIHLDVICYCHDENVDSLGRDMVLAYLGEFFDGDDIIDLVYKGYDIIC